MTSGDEQRPPGNVVASSQKSAIVEFAAMTNSLSILGHWSITHMDEWDQDFIDAEVKGYVRFDSDDRGEFQFGYVHGWMTCEMTEKGGRPAI